MATQSVIEYDSPDLIKAISEAPVSNPITRLVSCDPNDLVSAIVASRNDPRPDRIALANNCTYTFSDAYADTTPILRGPNALPIITDTLILDGFGAVIERSSDAPLFRLLSVGPTGNLTLNNLTIRGGQDNNFGGGGIYSWGSLTLDHTTVISNTSATFGGGINNSGGTLTVRQSTINGNSGHLGGGIVNQTAYGGSILGTLIMTDTVVSNNMSPQGQGGGLYTSGPTTLTDSTIISNTANSGGGIATLGTDQVDPILMTRTQVLNNTADAYGGMDIRSNLTMIDSTVANNSAAQVGGLGTLGGPTYTVTMEGSAVTGNSATQIGGLLNSVVMTLTDSLVNDNHSVRNAGGIHNNSGGTLALIRSTVANNTAESAAGIYNLTTSGMTLIDSTVSGNTAQYQGGGILNSSGNAMIIRSTVSENSSVLQGGGVLNTNVGTMTLVNSTLSGNSSAQGGGIYNGTSLTLINATISANTNGGLYSPGPATLVNTLIASQESGADCPYSNPITSNGYNLDSDNTCRLTNPVDLPGRNPLLGPLQDNLGPTLTRVPGVGSPAIDAGNPSVCALDPVSNLDQRGLGRPDGMCSIGAVEPHNTPVGTNVVVQPIDPAMRARPVRITYPRVIVQGSSGASSSSSFNYVAPPPDQNILRALYHISTSATYSGTIGICINYSDIVVTDQSRLRLLHFTNGAWEDVTTNVDMAAQEICGGTFSLSPFAITEIDPSVDITPPSISAPADITAEATSSTGAAVSYTPPTASDVIDPTPSVACLPASGATFALGVTEVVCTATDAAGNASSATFSVTVQDTTAPLLANIPANLTVAADSSSGAVVSYALPTATDSVDPAPAVACVPTAGSLFTVGTSVVTCSATDTVGNSSSATFQVTVTAPILDLTAPVLSGVPADITAEALSPDGVGVDYALPSASDDSDPSPAVSCAPVSTTIFPLGTSAVTCTATDAAGNSASASFMVTVEDTTPPTLINLPQDMTIATSDPARAVVIYSLPAASDMVDAAPSVACTPASGSLFALGTTKVACTAIDAAGNTSSAAFNISVVPATVVIRLLDSAGNGLADGSVEYYARGWQTLGSTDADGYLVTNLAQTSGYLRFRMTYAGGRQTLRQDIGTNPLVQFTTKHVMAPAPPRRPWNCCQAPTPSGSATPAGVRRSARILAQTR
ncbi:HYR domain-containing protein [Chloroflexales bacterium ZM16-3]|nr:HYR domain-containing protein [Chloroflexales bacterium ZM16-3]